MREIQIAELLDNLTFKTKNFTMELRNTVICKNSFKDFVSVNICQTTHYIAVLKYLANDFVSKTTTI
jgi:hypothetical protein